MYKAGVVVVNSEVVGMDPEFTSMYIASVVVG
jgi:hypothetical protein